MKLQIKKGSIDISVYVFIPDSSSTTGAGLTGLVFNSAGLTCYYVRPLGSATQLTLATQTVTGAHSDGGFVEVSSTNMPGLYRLDLSDTIVSSGVNSVVVMLKGATNMPPVSLEIELVAYDPQDTVRLGLTALPNAAAEAAGGLYTRGTGAGQINQDSNGRIDANVAAISTDSVAADNLESYTDGTTPQPVNVTQISGDTTSADNLESYTDGTTPMPVNATQISGDATAADNAESFFDGTGYAGTNNVIPTVTTVNGLAANTITSTALATSAVDEIVDAVWDEDATAHQTQGTFGQAIGDPGSDADSIWALANTNLDATVSSRASQTSVNTIDDFVDTEIADIQSRLPAALVGGKMDANVGAISGDSVAADNAESFFDGTGYAGTNNTIPTVTNVTNQVTANTTAISGDSVAADNAEAFFDGTGYAGTNNVIPTVSTVTNGVTLTAGQLLIKKGVQLTAFPFPMVDTTNADPTAGLTVSGFISKDGGAFAALTNAVAEISNGMYKITLTATETNATTIALRFTATGAEDMLITLVTQT